MDIGRWDVSKVENFGSMVRLFPSLDERGIYRTDILFCDFNFQTVHAMQ